MSLPRFALGAVLNSDQTLAAAQVSPAPDPSSAVATSTRVACCICS